MGLWLLGLLLTATSLSVQPIVQKLERHYRAVRTLRAVFLEIYRAGSSDIQIESGTAYFRRPGQMRWEYEEPEKKLFLVDGKRVWFYEPAARIVRRSSVAASSDWRTPLAYLTGKARLEQLCSSLTLVLPQGGPGTTEGTADLLCIARSSEQLGFRDALLGVDAQGRLVRLVIHQPGEVTIELRFADWKENLPLAAALFRFTPPAGVSILPWP